MVIHVCLNCLPTSEPFKHFQFITADQDITLYGEFIPRYETIKIFLMQLLLLFNMKFFKIFLFFTQNISFLKTFIFGLDYPKGTAAKYSEYIFDTIMPLVYFEFSLKATAVDAVHLIQYIMIRMNKAKNIHLCKKK